MITLRKLSFDNLSAVLQLHVNDIQKKFVEEASYTIALAYAGIMEGAPGELIVFYHEETPVGLVLIGKSNVGKQEPKILQQYGQVYRIIGFLIDERHQHKGFGRKALEMTLQKIDSYLDEHPLPIALEVKENNESAISLYKSVGFHNTGVRYDDDCVFVKLPSTTR
jgi:diamine N-acetyltransferase